MYLSNIICTGVPVPSFQRHNPELTVQPTSLQITTPTQMQMAISCRTCLESLNPRTYDLWPTKTAKLRIRPRMEKSHSIHPRTAWCVVNMFHKNGMIPFIRTNCATFYLIIDCNFQALYSSLKYMYSVVSVLLDLLPGNTKKQGIYKFVVIGVRFLHSWAVSKPYLQSLPVLSPWT